MSSATGKALLENFYKKQVKSLSSMISTGHMTIIFILNRPTNLTCKPFLPTQQKIKWVWPYPRTRTAVFKMATTKEVDAITAFRLYIYCQQKVWLLANYVVVNKAFIGS